MSTRIFVAFSLMLCAAQGLAQSGNFRLDCQIQGMNEGKAILSIVSFSDTESPVRDTAVIEKGQFTFKGALKSPVLADISILPNRLRMSVFLETGHMKMKGSVTDTTLSGMLRVNVSGSKSHQEYERVSSFKRNEIDSVFNRSRIEKDEERKAALRARVDELNELITKNNIKFVQSHLNSAVSAYYMIFNTSDYNMPFSQLKHIVTNFGPVPKSTPYYRRIKDEFDILANIQPGEVAPDFSLNKPDGQSMSLSSLKGKLVLIDFWASWCLPCRQSFPRMKELYAKFRNRGFEILGVPDDSKKEAWLKAMNDDNLPWPQVIDEFPEKYKPARVGTLYGVHYIPSTVLVDKEGKIVDKNLDDKKLDETLEKMLEK